MVMFVEHVFPHLHIASVLKIPIDAPKILKKKHYWYNWYYDDVEELYL